jgi:pimeloyl-ACP methyl ester carboxylesterase
LLIHGFGVGTYTFNKNIPELSKSHKVFACDLLGQGASWPSSQPQKEDGLEYSIDTWAEQLASFIKDVIADERGVYLAGNSLGGLLAVTVAYRYPEVCPLVTSTTHV